jgi:hypothetical protein
VCAAGPACLCEGEAGVARLARGVSPPGPDARLPRAPAAVWPGQHHAGQRPGDGGEGAQHRALRRHPAVAQQRPHRLGARPAGPRRPALLATAARAANQAYTHNAQPRTAAPRLLRSTHQMLRRTALAAGAGAGRWTRAVARPAPLIHTTHHTAPHRAAGPHPPRPLAPQVPNTDTLHALIREYRESKKIPLNWEHRWGAWGGVGGGARAAGPGPGPASRGRGRGQGGSWWLALCGRQLPSRRVGPGPFARHVSLPTHPTHPTHRRLMQGMAPDYEHLTVIQKVEVFEHALDSTSGGRPAGTQCPARPFPAAPPRECQPGPVLATGTPPCFTHCQQPYSPATL